MRSVKFLLVLVVSLFSAASAFGQNWVPEAGSVDRVFSSIDRPRGLVYAEAMSLTDINPAILKTYIASFKLADVQKEHRHQQVLIAVAISWQEKEGIVNPVAKRYSEWRKQSGGKKLTVTDEELINLYRQVLVDQGLSKGETDGTAKTSPDDAYRVLYR